MWIYDPFQTHLFAEKYFAVIDRGFAINSRLNMQKFRL